MDAIAILLDEMIACPNEYLAAWAISHQSLLTEAYFWHIKTQCASSDAISQDSQRADAATQKGLYVAELVCDENSTELAIARWSRANYLAFTKPREAIQLGERAAITFQSNGDALNAAKLRVSMSFMLMTCGEFEAAEAALLSAESELRSQYSVQPFLLLMHQRNYGLLLHYQGRYHEALAAHQWVIDEAGDDPKYSEIVCGARTNWSWTMCALARFDEAEKELLRVRKLAEVHQQALSVARIDLDLGLIYVLLGQPATALHQLHIAEREFVLLRNDLEIGTVRWELGMLFQRIGAWRASVENLSFALKVFEEQKMPVEMCEALLEIATVRRQRREYKLASVALTKAENLAQSIEGLRWNDLVLFERIELALATKQYLLAVKYINEGIADGNNSRSRAWLNLLNAETQRLSSSDEFLGQTESLYRDALHYANSHLDQWMKVRAMLGLGKLLSNTQPGEAHEILRDAASLIELLRQTLSVEELKAGFHQHTHSVFEELVHMAFMANEPLKALEYIWRAKAGSIIDLLLTRQTRPFNRSSSLDQEIEVLRKQLAALRSIESRQITRAIPDLSVVSNTPAIAQLEQRLLELRRQRNQQHLFSKTNLLEHPAKVLASMDCDLLIEFYQSGEFLYGFAAERSGTNVIKRLTTLATIEPLLMRLKLTFRNVVVRESSRRTELTDEWLDECLPALHTLFDLLVKPLLSEKNQIGHDTSISIAPCGTLMDVPFAALWDGHQYLVEKHEIHMIQCGVLFSIPKMEPEMFSSPVVIAVSQGQMQAVRDEATHVAALLRTTPLIDEPSVGMLKALTTPPSVLHISAHTIEHNVPLFVALQLADETLSVEECYELPLIGTHLVTLSACRTSAGLDHGGELLAFQTAMFVAGAQNLLTSLWYASDDGSLVWMSNFYDAYSGGASVAKAVRATQLTLLKQNAYRHPAIWAAFACWRCNAPQKLDG
jgi:tetratricopeptide (TPR) repeat protein